MGSFFADTTADLEDAGLVLGRQTQGKIALFMGGCTLAKFGEADVRDHCEITVAIRILRRAMRLDRTDDKNLFLDERELVYFVAQFGR